jgi:signal transduction histidine kinase
MLAPVLHEFLIANREEILARSRKKLVGRKIPTPTAAELKDGLPLFLDQLVGILRASAGDRTAGHRSVTVSAALHGGALLRMGLTVGQVVQDYGSICQSVTELADEQDAAITPDEFQTFNRCLDDAIAQAVTSYEHQRDQTAAPSAAHLGSLAHEMRNLLNTAMLTYETVARGRVGIQGTTGSLLGRTLRRMRVLIDRTLSEARLEAGAPVPERLLVAELLEEIEVVATLEANDHNIGLSIDVGPDDLAVVADRQILASVVANLVQNAFKFTRPHGHIRVRARLEGGRVLIDVQDECGGLPPGGVEDLFVAFEQRGVDRSGMGLGLSISRKGARASGGEIHVRDVPGSGCVFTVDLPRAPQRPSLARAAAPPE